MTIEENQKPIFLNNICLTFNFAEAFLVKSKERTNNMKVTRRKKRTANVGIFGVGFHRYWSQFDGLLDELKQKYTELKIIGYTDLKGFIDAQVNIAKEFGITPEEGGAHAGEIETSFILALEEKLVVKELML